MQLPRITVQRWWPGAIEVAHDDELPKEYMDQYKKILGDAQARVTVSTDMSLKEYGSGAGAMVSVSLACGQDQESIEQAVDMAGQLARAYAKEQHKLADQEWQTIKQAQANKAF